MKNTFPLLAILLVAACQTNHRETAIAEITKAESDFNKMASDSGIANAFLHFAAPDAVILRGNHCYQGLDSIAFYFQNTDYQNVSLSWRPNFIEAAASGDLGYTYGKYQLSATDSSGTTQTHEGYFHTVWQRQPNGIWRFVWD